MRPVLLEQFGEGHAAGWQEAGGATYALGGAERVWQPLRHYAQVVRCRACPACLRARRRLWTARGISEWRVRELLRLRSWFATLTVRPSERDALEAMTRARVGPAFDALSDDEKFKERLREYGPLMTNWLKRLRKAGAAFSYFAVWERHRDGTPHAHVLLHENDAARPLRWRVLEGKWPHGHCSFKVVADAKGVGYVAKYLGKEALARVRASRRYGVDVADAEGVGDEPSF